MKSEIISSRIGTIIAFFRGPVRTSVRRETASGVIAGLAGISDRKSLSAVFIGDRHEIKK